MYILKNAFVSITRNKGRNILIGIIVLVIGCAAAVTLAIRNSADSLISSYENSSEVMATITTDRSALMQNIDPSDSSSKEDMHDKFNNIESLTVADVKNYGESEYVKNYYYTASIGVDVDNIEAAVSNFQDNNHKMPGTDSVSNTSFTIKGYSSVEAMEDFISGNYTISDGKISTDFTDNSCIINSELATLNDLDVGDTLTIIDPDNSKNTYEFMITGIFTENSNDSGMSMFSNSANTIITNATAVEKIYANNNDLKMEVNPTFVLISKDAVDFYEAELNRKGLSQYLTLSTNLEQVDSVTNSVANVKTFATTFLIITLIIGAIVLFVINLINIRERKYEIGVLRTMGMKKTSVSLQFITELFIVAFISLIIGASIGASISVPISNKLLASEINSSSKNAQQINNNFGGALGNANNNSGKENPKDKMQNINGFVNVEAISDINAVVDIKVLLELLGLGLVVILISSISALISINRFSPLTILKERS